MNIELIKENVKYNCNISDAIFWGYYSPCGFLLSMQELFCHENGIDPWKTPKKEEVIPWITAREAMWEKIEEKEFVEISIYDSGKQTFNPFDSTGINHILARHNYFYHAGYGLLKKPTFFLAEILAKKNQQGFQISIVSNLLCRGLSPPMAFAINSEIVLNLDLLSKYIFHRFILWQSRKVKSLADEVFGFYNISRENHLQKELYSRIEYMAKTMLPIIICHEIGELEEGKQVLVWKDLLLKARDRITEFNLRAIMDIIADTSKYGPLHYIYLNKDTGLLMSYLLLMDDIRKKLFPEIFAAYNNFKEKRQEKRDWSVIKKAISAGFYKAKKIQKQVVNKWEKSGSIEDIEKIIRIL